MTSNSVSPNPSCSFCDSSESLELSIITELQSDMFDTKTETISITKLGGVCIGLYIFQSNLHKLLFLHFYEFESREKHKGERERETQRGVSPTFRFIPYHDLGWTEPGEQRN